MSETAIGLGMLERRLERNLRSGQKALRRMRLGVGGVMVLIGLGSGVASEFIVHLEFTASGGELLMFITAQTLLMQLRYFALNLAPLADDVSFTRCILVMELAISLLYVWSTWFAFLQTLQTPDTVGHVRSLMCFVQLIWAGVLGCGLIAAMFQRGAHRIQKFMWMALSLYLWLRVVSLTAGIITLLVVGQINRVRKTVCMVLLWISGNLLTILVISRPHLRQAVHARLGRVFAARSAARAAAGLACLVRGGSAREVLEEARRRFRVVSLACLAFEDTETNQPDPSLFSKTVAAQLGRCDAFVSHSWHDDADAKWAALQSWREAFKRQHSREPCVWFDKFCIDQQDINANLRSLPVFLSGCEKLIILYGPTYLERLWCVLEVFTFVHIGGSLDRVELLPVLRAGFVDGDMADVEAAIQQFTVEDCKCFLEQDKECMTTIILTAYGSLDAFSDAVRSIFNNDTMKRCLSGADESATGHEAVHLAFSDTSESSDVASSGASESSFGN